MVNNNNVKDRRVIRTLELLKQSSIVLLKKKNITSITVKEITSLANLNRGTFYLHYKDVYDMLESMQKEVIEELRTCLTYRFDEDPSIRVNRIYQDLFDYIEKNIDFCSVMLGENGNMSFFEQIKTVVKESCFSLWEELFNLEKKQYFDAFASFLVGGCISLVQNWIETGHKESSQEMASIATEIVLQGSKILK